MTDQATVTAATDTTSPNLSAIALAAKTALQTILTLLIQFGVGSSSVAAVVIQDLIVILPIVADELPEMLATVQNILAVLKNSGALTEAQIARVQSLQAQADAGFDTAASAYLENHPAPANPQ